MLETTASRIRIAQSDTDRTGYDTGAFASTGTTVAGKAVELASEALCARILAFAAEHSGVPVEACRLEDDAVICDGRRIDLAELHAAAQRAGRELASMRKATNSPRTVAFNVQGFRVAVHRRTGQIVILQSVQAADVGRVLNPMQCRGQVEGAVAQAIGWTLYEKMVFDDQGHLLNPTFRNYRIPAFADVPRTEVHFADTVDAVGPFGAKSVGEGPFNCVAPALANAVADATGVRFRTLPLAPDRIFASVSARFSEDA
jgi:CO/xanthine dehydrogenase Mo-binding subunit